MARVLLRRALASALGLAFSAALLLVCMMHASHARALAADRAAGLHDVARVLPAADVAFTGGARWVRAPSLEEPAAAQADGIAFPDPEPGSGAMTPPARAWAEAP